MIFSRQNLEKFTAALHNVRWSFVQEEDDPQIAYNLFSDTFLNLYNLHFPLREVRFNKNHHIIKPWMSKGLLVSRLRKHELASLSVKNPSPNSISIFKSYRNLYKTKHYMLEKSFIMKANYLKMLTILRKPGILFAQLQIAKMLNLKNSFLSNWLMAIYSLIPS